MIDVLTRPTPFLFFTGKGGVGKTSSACAAALQLARDGKRVLIVSTDPASNLDAVLDTVLEATPTPVEGAPNLFGLNIDPEEAARTYRERVVGPYRGILPDSAVASIEEQLSGACTVEVAAFDEFTGLMSNAATLDAFDHIVFDTAPTGHTLRLLQLPSAWTSFMETNERGASCLGPLSGLKNQQERYTQALSALSDPARTTLVLVTRPERSALLEAERTRIELDKQGVTNQFLLINGVFRASDRDDALARRLEEVGQTALREMPAALRELPSQEVPLKPYNLVGLDALAAFFVEKSAPLATPPEDAIFDMSDFAALSGLVDDVAAAGHGLVMFMGKGGVGKTTLAAATAVELASRGLPVHLTTTDPAAHLEGTLAAEVPNLRVSRIDPHAETEAYRERILERSRPVLDDDAMALLQEDLLSPCTEEVAVFHAFSKVVFSAKREIVVMDTAPTGHTLLLLDATGSYHRESVRQTAGSGVNVGTPLMRLQNPEETRVVVVALAETTPVQEAAHLQEDLRRAHIEPYAWVINRCLAATQTTDPLLRARAHAERAQMRTVADRHADRVYVVPWSADEPTGAQALRDLMSANPA
jgi:arsenite/tail-anchored protein-transporting ATPase